MLSESLQTFAAGFYRHVDETFQRAVSKLGGTHDFDFSIAGHIVRLSFAGTATVAALTRALAHLRVHGVTTAEITIQIWEVQESGIAPPPPIWGTDAYAQRGEVRGFNDARYATVFHPDGRVLFVYDAVERRGTVVVFDTADLPAYERAAPLRPILTQALALYGTQYAHAGAVGFPDGGVLLAGKSGAGKSTTSLACLNSDLLFAGDDYCALQVDKQPIAHSLYNSAKGTSQTVAHLPFLEPYIQFWDTEGSAKAIWYLYEHLPHKMISQFPLCAILLPRVTRQVSTHLISAPPHAALVALAPSTIQQLPNADAQVLRRLAVIARHLPCYYLDVGTDMAQIPQTIENFLYMQGARQ